MQPRVRSDTDRNRRDKAPRLTWVWWVTGVHGRVFNEEAGSFAQMRPLSDLRGLLIVGRQVHKHADISRRVSELGALERQSSPRSCYPTTPGRHHATPEG